MDNNTRALVTDQVGEGWTIITISRHCEGFNKISLNKFEFETITASINYEVRKMGKYIFISSEENNDTLLGLVVPKGVNHKAHCRSFTKYVANHLSTKVYVHDSYWMMVNSFKYTGYTNSDDILVDNLLGKINRAKKFSKSGNVVNINLVFHGLPGTGKSKMAMDLAVGLKKNIYIIDPRDIGRLENIESGNVILLEELDKILSPNGEFLDPEKNKVGQLLQLLDGASRPRKSVIIITCNDINLLMKNPVLSRPGRNTDIIEFGYVRRHQCDNLCRHLYPDISDTLLDALWDSLKDMNVTIAELSTYANNCAISDTACDVMVSNVKNGIKRIKGLTSNNVRSLQYY